jgi:hypothetical protein
MKNNVIEGHKPFSVEYERDHALFWNTFQKNNNVVAYCYMMIEWYT